MNQTYAYVRVSSTDQKTDRQLAAMKAQNVPDENIFTDYQSGKDFNRPAYKNLMKKLKNGDLLLIHSIDRLGRNYDEILEQWRFICKKKKADIRVLDMPLLDTTIAKDLLGTLICDLVLQLLSYVAQQERDFNKIRQEEGIIEAKKNGVVFGRPKKGMPEDFEQQVDRWRGGEILFDELKRLLDMSSATIYRRLDEMQSAPAVAQATVQAAKKSLD